MCLLNQMSLTTEWGFTKPNENQIHCKFISHTGYPDTCIWFGDFEHKHSQSLNKVPHLSALIKKGSLSSSPSCISCRSFKATCLSSSSIQNVGPVTLPLNKSLLLCIQSTAMWSSVIMLSSCLDRKTHNTWVTFKWQTTLSTKMLGSSGKGKKHLKTVWLFQHTPKVCWNNWNSTEFHTIVSMPETIKYIMNANCIHTLHITYIYIYIYIYYI